ncbi:methylamine utilization protein [Pseudoalteromonas mariniglutinosa]|uniref:methylamine utilization protein n=1 Tax=Pseudoalteromonas mariniglutinosa TaxID=206042 RepID=UPI00384CCA52
MIPRLLKRILCGLTFLFAQAVFAADITVLISDQHGQPLNNAVVEVKTERPQARSALPLAIMDQVAKQFKPLVLVVEQGQQVNFPNSDNIRHHVYSFSETKPFQLKLYSGQPEAPITFDNNGVVVLGCNIHDSMVGYIYVAKGGMTIKTDESGQAMLKEITLPAEITVWQPLQAAPLEQTQRISLAENSPSSLQVTINTTAPTPRNTFGSKFKGGND